MYICIRETTEWGGGHNDEGTESEHTLGYHNDSILYKRNTSRRASSCRRSSDAAASEHAGNMSDWNVVVEIPLIELFLEIGGGNRDVGVDNVLLNTGDAVSLATSSSDETGEDESEGGGVVW